MKRFLTFALIAALGACTIGCETKKGTDENNTETTTTQTRNDETTGDRTMQTRDDETTSDRTPQARDGKTIGETQAKDVKTTSDMKTKTTTPAAGGMKPEKTPEKTTEKTPEKTTEKTK